MHEVNASHVWFYRNQPHGFWKSGNPLVKACCVFVLVLAACIRSIPLMLQGTALCLVLVHMPPNPKSRILNVLVNFGLGGLIIAFVGEIPSAITFRTTTDIPHIATVDWQLVICYVLVFLALFFVRRAVTSRDLAWMLDLLPGRWKELVGAQVYAYIYGFFRGPDLFWTVNEVIQSRGGCRLLGRKPCGRLSVFIDLIGIRVLNFLRQIDDMAITVDYVLSSRIRLIERGNPSRRAWSDTDYSMMGLVVLVIVLPRVLHMIAQYGQ